MGIISTIHSGIQEEHKKTDSKPFLQRYKAKEASPLDHYQHLNQLLPLYQLMESKMKAPNFPFPLIANYFQQSEKIQKDLDYLKLQLPFAHRKPILLSSTKKYLAIVEECEGEALLAHYLTRVLGDLYGGQKIKKDVITMYHAYGFSLQSDPTKSGISFYTFEEKALLNFGSLLSKQPIDDIVNVVEQMNVSLQQHQKIFEELESTRVILPKRMSYSQFFKKNAVALILTTAVALTALTAINR